MKSTTESLKRNTMASEQKKQRRREAFQNAFYIDNDESNFSERDIQLLDKFAVVAVRRRMTSAFIFFLELHRPLNYLTSQALTFATPLLDVLMGMVRPMIPWLFTKEELDQLAKILENRKSVEKLIERVHHYEDEYDQDPAGFKYKYPRKTKAFYEWIKKRNPDGISASSNVEEADDTHHPDRSDNR